MAYNVAANMRPTRPGAAFLERRDQVARNALMEREVAGQEQSQAFNQQNALMQRERQAQADQLAMQDRQQAAEQDEAKQVYTYMSHLAKIAANPEQFQATAQRMVQSPLFQKIGIQLEDLTPEEVMTNLPAFAAEAGIGPDGGSDQRVQSAQILANGNIAYLTVDGKLVDTGQKAKEQLQLTEIGGGRGIVNLRDRDVTMLSPAEQERQAAAAQAAAVSGAGQQAKDEASRNMRFITDGMDAADAIAITRRGLELLQETRTGGINVVALKARNLFGVTGADEGELSANLGKAVLAQLRATFGAQFTEREGARLAEIEAGFGKSTEANRRLLEQAEKILERTARRGLAAAEAAGDAFAAQEIRNNLDRFSLSPNGQNQATQQPSQPQSTGGWGQAIQVR